MWREEQVFSTQLSKGGYVPQRWGHTHPTVFTVWVVCWFSYVFFCSYGALFPSRSYSLQLSLFSLGFFLSFRHLFNFCNDFRFTVRCHTWLNSSSCQFFWPLIFSTVTRQVQVMQSCFESWECKCSSKNSSLFEFLYISICFALFPYSSWLFRRICIYLFIWKTPLENNKVALNSLKCLLIYIENIYIQKYC